MKQSKFVILMEAASLAYMIAILWVLFPDWHAPLAAMWRGASYRWRLGRNVQRILSLPGWAQEAAIVRGRMKPTAPRPFNLPLLDGD